MEERRLTLKYTATLGLAAVLASCLSGLQVAANEEPAADLGLVIDRFDLQVNIQDAVAVTEASLTATNPSHDSVEFSLELPLSSSAVLTNITLVTHNETWTGTVVEKNKAQTVYNASKEAGQTAVLLRSAGKGRLLLDLNVAANTTVRLDATYVELLPIVQGDLAFRFPLSRLGAAYGPIPIVTIRADLASTHPWKELSVSGIPSSPEVDEDRTQASVAYEAMDAILSEDFVIELEPEASGYVSDMVLSGLGPDSAFALRLLPPGFGPVPIPLDVVFVLDHSGSMEGDKMVQAKTALQAIIDELRPGDRFSIVKFDETVTTMHPWLLPATVQDRTSAKSWVGEIEADGATNLEGGVAEALGLLSGAESSGLPMVVLFTDGLPTAGIMDHGEILSSIDAKNAAEARVHTVGIGLDQDNAFLAELAGSNKGFYETIGPDEPVEETLRDFYTRISTPILRDVSIQLQGIQAREVYPDPLPDVYQGSHLILAARADLSDLPNEIAVVLSGNDSTGPVTYTIRLPTTDLAVRTEVERLWARQKAQSLERDLERADDASDQASLRAQILEAGLAYQIETLETSWIMVVPDVPGLEPVERLTGRLAADLALTHGATTATGAYSGGGGAASRLPRLDSSETPTAGIAVFLALVTIAVVARRR